MLPEEWPIRPPAERGSFAPATSAGSDRLSTARRDFFLPPAQRLTEQERALMTAMLHRLVEDVSVEIQSRLPREWLPANEDHAGLIDRLSGSGLLDTDSLMALLLRRADEERIATAFNARPGSRAVSIIQPLVSGEDSQVAAAAMSVLIARGRRRDRYGQPLVELDDLSPEAAALLVHAVAAALCERKPLHVSNSDEEEAVCNAANALLERHDPAKSLDRLTAELVRLLDEGGLLDDGLARLVIDNADMGVLRHLLARRAAIDPANAAAELFSGESRRIMLLLRLARVSREVAGHLFALLGDLLGLGADLHALAIFDSFTEERLAIARSWLGLDLNFKHALKALGHGHGTL
ncbi:MAG: hypothetical protein ABIQ32_03225 [Sphingomicrobium sp.]